MCTEETVKAYYQAWVDNDKKKARSLLHNSLSFRSPQDNFDSADKFINACWKYAAEFNQMEYIHTVFDNNSGYVVYKSGDFCCGELVIIENGLISEIYVTFNPTH